MRGTRRLATGLRTTLLLIIVSAILSAGPARATSGETVYQGTARITVETFDFCGGSVQRRLADRRRTTVPVTFGVVARKSDATMTETNPFGFFLSYGQVGRPASGGLSSSIVALTPSGRRYLAQYWTATVRGTRFSARLTDAHEAEGGSGAQSLWVDRPLVGCRPEMSVMTMIEALAEGATLTGTVTTTSVSLRLQATTIDSLNTVDLQFTAQATSR